MRWEDSLGANLAETWGSNSFRRVLDSKSVYNDARSCHSKGAHLPLTERPGAGLSQVGLGMGKGREAAAGDGTPGGLLKTWHWTWHSEKLSSSFLAL